MTKKPDGPPAPPTTKECPKCLMTIPIKAAKCGHCTSEITASC
jgi:large conductance mechanosensitive channel